jgi:competence protein ComEC
VVATFVLLAPVFGRQLSPLHFMTTMLAVVLAYNPGLIYSVGFQLSVAAVAGILLLREPFRALIQATALRPFGPRAKTVADLLAVSLAAQVATAPIIASTFGQVSIIGVLTNLFAVPLSGPILTLGMLGAFAGNVLPALAYPINASNGFLVSVLERVAEAFSSLPFAAVTTPDIGPLLMVLLYAGCVPAAVSRHVFPKERWNTWAAIAVAWSGLWLALVSLPGG